MANAPSPPCVSSPVPPVAGSPPLQHCGSLQNGAAEKILYVTKHLWVPLVSTDSDAYMLLQMSCTRRLIDADHTAVLSLLLLTT